MPKSRHIQLLAYDDAPLQGYYIYRNLLQTSCLLSYYTRKECSTAPIGSIYSASIQIARTSLLQTSTYTKAFLTQSISRSLLRSILGLLLRQKLAYSFGIYASDIFTLGNSLLQLSIVQSRLQEIDILTVLYALLYNHIRFIAGFQPLDYHLPITLLAQTL